MLVFAFDRDWTVDVNPHPHHEAVPLEWVRHLAHETEHAVYAIGNQRLAEEAAIPGVVDVVGRHREDWNRLLGSKRPDGRYERFPTRRKRLSLIADLYPGADGYVVVDDLDLGDVDGWDHYHAWEFVPAVEAGDVDPALPWVTAPRTDGGSRLASLEPTDAAKLSDWIDGVDDDRGFQLTYTEDGTETTVLLHDLSVVERTVRRPSAAIAVRCIPVSPNVDTFTLRVTDIVTVSIAEIPSSLYTAGAESPTAEAKGLKGLAAARPADVPIPALIALLQHDDNAVQHEALGALRRVVADRPAECRAAIPCLEELFKEPDRQAPSDAFRSLRLFAEADAGDVTHLLDHLIPVLNGRDILPRIEAARCLSEVAVEQPDAVLDSVPSLATCVEDDDATTPYAVFALNCVAKAYPEEIKPVVGQLGSIVVDDEAQDNVRLNATAALGRVVCEYPDVATAIVDDVAALLNAKNHQLRNNVIGLLGDVATMHPDLVEPHVETIASQLPDDDVFTRINASAVLARVAEASPRPVVPVTPTFVDLLDDDHEVVRENACWALGHLRADAGTDHLRELRSTDPVDSVRARAAWALQRADGADR